MTDHGSDLGEPVLLTEQPQVLAVALLGSLDLRDDTLRVVGTELTQIEGKEKGQNSQRVMTRVNAGEMKQ